MSFRWSLQRLLDVTGKRELAVKAELLSLSRQIGQLQQDIQRRLRMLRQLLDDLGSRQLAERLCLQDVVMRSCQAEQIAIEQIEAKVRELDRQRQDKTQALAELVAKRQTLESKRAEARREYQKLLDRREQNLLDETFQVGFARQGQARLVTQQG